MYECLVQKVIENGKVNPNKIAIGFSKRRITYAELSADIRKCAFLLANNFKLSVNQKVMISASSTPEYITVFLAIQLLGAVTVPIDKNEKDSTIESLCDFIKPTLLITDIKFSEELPKNIEKKNQLKIHSLKGLCENARNIDEYSCPPEIKKIQDDSVIEMLFTTGTTSAPKCAMHTLKSINTIIQNTIIGTEMTESDVVLNPLPLNHSAGLRVLRAALFIGATTVLQAGFVFAKTLDTNINDFCCTRLVCVPASIELLRKQMQCDFEKILGKLSKIEIAAGALSVRLRKELSVQLPNTLIINTWGSTETGGAIFWTNRILDKIDSLGRPADCVKVKTVDINGNEIKSIDADTAGRMCLTGDMLMTGYFNNLSASEEALKSGSLVTNDLVYQDDEGFLYMLGRADDIINIGGEKIAPFEIENVALQFESLRECACIGVDDPDGVLGQISVLYVVFEEDFSDIKSFEDFLVGKLERYKIPHKIIKIGTLPRNRMKKIDRNALRQKWKDSLKTENSSSKDILEIMKTRQSIRDFTDGKISRNILEQIVECGIYAPSGHNMQTWQFTVITNSEKISSLKNLIAKVSSEKGFQFFGYNNPAAVIIVTNDRRNETGIQDSSAASQNIMLAAHSFGLGSVWVNALSRICDEDEIRVFLSGIEIPEKHIVVSTICIGYPKNVRKPIERKNNVIKYFE